MPASKKAPAKSLSIALPVRIWLKVRHHALDQGCSASAVVEQALEKYFDRPSKTEPPKEGET